MTTNPRFATRSPKADNRRDRKGPPVIGKPLPNSVERQFQNIFAAKR